MIQYNSRITINNGIKFYEQDIVYDDYLYSDNIDITLTLDYANPGFGVALINNESNSVINCNAIMFKLGNGVFEIIEKNNNNHMNILFSTSASPAKPYTSDLLFKISNEIILIRLL